ncbi:hypothetical protein [Burkholderia phage BCSR5]|nr:hypothetical protein [Burkholderia phage BCSR5]
MMDLVSYHTMPPEHVENAVLIAKAMSVFAGMQTVREHCTPLAHHLDGTPELWQPYQPGSQDFFNVLKFFKVSLHYAPNWFCFDCVVPTPGTRSSGTLASAPAAKGPYTQAIVCAAVCNRIAEVIKGRCSKEV